MGVLAGGVMAGIFGLWVEHRSHLNSRSREIAGLRRAEYFSAIDSVHRLRRALERFRAALSGRWQPADDDDSEEAEEMRSRDQEGAASFEALDQAIDDLRNTTLKVRAVGSDGVSAAIDEVDTIVGEYFMSAFEEGPVFKADRFEKFFASYLETCDKLVRLIRVDLEIDRVYLPKS